MRYNTNHRKVSLIDFIIDVIYDIPEFPMDTPITEVKDAADKIADEMKEHIQAALKDINIDDIVS